MKKKMYTVYTVDEYSIEKVMDETRKDTDVLGLLYTGEALSLERIESFDGEKPVIKRIYIEKPDSEIVGKLSEEYPRHVRVVLRLPDDFKDMRFIKEMSLKHRNISFCGEGLARLPGCSIGCIQDVVVSEKEVSYTFQGKCCSIVELQKGKCKLK